MKDPRRLLEDARLPELERRALSAAQSAEPPRELVQSVWAELALGAGAAGTAGATAAKASAAKAGAATLPASAGMAGKVAVLKALAIGATVGVVATGGAVALTGASHAPSQASSAASAWTVSAPSRNAEQRKPSAAPALRDESAPPPAAEGAPLLENASKGPSGVPGVDPTSVVVRAQPPAPEPSPRDAPMAAYEATAPSASSGARQNDAAQREARLIGVARETLQAHDPQGALVLLEDGARRFPSGILLQEREALSISALAALGRTAEASARARAFLKNFPSSPHAERVRAVLNR